MVNNAVIGLGVGAGNASAEPAPICYVEIPAPNVEVSAAFYRDVFGWTIDPSELTDQKYQMFNSGEDGVMGGLDSNKKVQLDAGVILYLRVDDIAGVLAAICAAGGEQVRGKFPIGAGYGFSAIFRDPAGNQMGLWARE